MGGRGIFFKAECKTTRIHRRSIAKQERGCNSSRALYERSIKIILAA